MPASARTCQRQPSSTSAACSSRQGLHVYHCAEAAVRSSDSAGTHRGGDRYPPSSPCLHCLFGKKKISFLASRISLSPGIEVYWTLSRGVRAWPLYDVTGEPGRAPAVSGSRRSRRRATGRTCRACGSTRQCWSYVRMRALPWFNAPSPALTRSRAVRPGPGARCCRCSCNSRPWRSCCSCCWWWSATAWSAACAR